LNLILGTLESKGVKSRCHALIHGKWFQSVEES